MTNLGAGSPAPFFWRLSTGNEANKLEPLLFRGGVARLTNLFVSRSGVVFRGARGAPHNPIRLKARLRRTKSHCPSSEEEGLGQRQFLPPTQATQQSHSTNIAHIDPPHNTTTNTHPLNLPPH